MNNLRLSLVSMYLEPFDCANHMSDFISLIQLCFLCTNHTSTALRITIYRLNILIAHTLLLNTYFSSSFLMNSTVCHIICMFDWFCKQWDEKIKYVKTLVFENFLCCFEIWISISSHFNSYLSRFFRRPLFLRKNGGCMFWLDFTNFL